jgi:desulfoferrodoxin (superoxide reductase-like protein)
MGSKLSTEISSLVRIEDFDEARHVGALEVMGQADVHVEAGNRVAHAAALVQHLDRMAYRP